ncbi:unnamed protein product [Malus baccata var. baccata]
MANQILLLTTFLAMTCSLVVAFEPSPLQDFCVADATSSATRVNGLPCLDSKLATAEHFFFSGLHIPGNTSNPVGGKVTPVNVAQIPGLNTLGISLARIDYAPMGVIPPHTHPRATEILTVLEGSLDVGFVTSNPDNKLISKKNVGTGMAVSLSSLSSQNPGVNTIANAVFGSNPPISEDVLAKSFQVDKSVITSIQAKF